MMQPAFDSTRQAAAFALLVLVLLLLPLIIGQGSLPPRKEVYSPIWWANGPFPYVQHEIFDEKGDIDIAFMGSSHMLHGIDTPYVQEKLSEQLGRPSVVRSICWSGAGFDSLYFITRDLLQHRNVHMLVFYDDYNPGWYAAAALTPRWFRFADNAEALSGLPLRFQLCYYFAAIIGMPRNLLSLIRSNIPVDLISKKKNYLENLFQAPNPVTRMGSMSAHIGFGVDGIPDSENAPFVDFAPPTGKLPSQVSIYSQATKAMFEFPGPPTPTLPLYFVRKFAMLAQEHGVKLVLLHVPYLSRTTDPTVRRDPVIREREFWPDVLHADITIMGISPAKLYAGMTDDEVHKLFYNPAHLNKNGQEYFTQIITPSILEIYAAQANH
jgi:hypothetical protein